jgi:hypothetical protein
MSTQPRPTISVHLDATSNELSILDSEGQPLGTWLLAGAECKALQADDLERQLGASIFSVLSGLIGRSVGNRDYLHQHEAHSSAMLKRLRAELAAGNEQLIVYLAQHLLSDARRNNDLSAIAGAEAELRRAAAGGNLHASDYLAKQWPQEKQQATDAVTSSGQGKP